MLFLPSKPPCSAGLHSPGGSPSTSSSCSSLPLSLHLIVLSLLFPFPLLVIHFLFQLPPPKSSAHSCPFFVFLRSASIMFLRKSFLPLSFCFFCLLSFLVVFLFLLFSSSSASFSFFLFFFLSSGTRDLLAAIHLANSSASCYLLPQVLLFLLQSSSSSLPPLPNVLLLLLAYSCCPLTLVVRFLLTSLYIPVLILSHHLFQSLLLYCIFVYYTDDKPQHLQKERNKTNYGNRGLI